MYFNSLWGAFVSDDYATIPQNPQVTSIKAAWSSSFFINLFKTLIAVVFGNQNPIPYHVACLLVYLLVCVLAFVFLSLFYEALVVKVTMIIFAVLPVHVEAVSWISGIPYLLTSALVLGGLVNLVLFLKKRNKKYLLTLLGLALVSLFTDRIRGFSLVLLSGLVLVSFPEKFKFKFKIGLLNY